MRTASWFRTGSAPGRPRQTAQVWMFGGSPKLVTQPQNALVRVSSCACTSRPMTDSYSVLMLAGDARVCRIAGLVARIGCLLRPVPGGEAHQEILLVDE